LDCQYFMIAKVLRLWLWRSTFYWCTSDESILSNKHSNWSDKRQEIFQSSVKEITRNEWVDTSKKNSDSGHMCY
jgi:hypothetical protein